MKKLLLASVAVLSLVPALAHAQAIDLNKTDGTVSLACKGTVADPINGKQPVPISTGIVVTPREVTAFGFTVRTLAWSDALVVFGGESAGSGMPEEYFTGHIDRITLDAYAWSIPRGGTINGSSTTSYILKCKPVQRAF